MADISKLNVNNTDYNIKDATARSSLSNKMDKSNPTGTGSLSLNRKANTTVGTNSVAVGIATTASGSGSFAEGNETVASGTRAHAEGEVSTASGYTAHAEGTGTTASGNYSHAEGENTIANHRAQHVFGQNNVADTSTASENVRGNFIEIVGNGANTSNRSNARTLDWNGNETLAGDLKINGNQSLSKLWTTLSGLTVLSGKSGSIASFSTDIADKLFSCYVNVTAVQAGSGTPAPDNVRAISGWSGINVSRAGKNLIIYTLQNATIGADGKIYASSVQQPYDMQIAAVIKGQTYTIKSDESSNVNQQFVGGFFYAKPAIDSYSYDGTRIANAPATFTAPITGYVAFRTSHNYSLGQCELGSSPTTYEAPTGTQITLPFGQTVYGGTLDVLSGVLTVTHYYISDLSQLTFYFESPHTFRATPPQFPALPADNMAVCSCYASFIGSLENLPDKSAVISGGGSYIFIRIRDDDYTDATAFKNSLSGQTLVYKLATPTTIQLTPTEVKTILGQNNIFADTGDIDLKYLETIGNRL